MSKQFKELQKKPATDLSKEISRLKFDLMKLRTQAAAGSAGKEAGKIRAMRRQIARIHTLMQRSSAAVTKKGKEVASKQ